MRFNQVSMMSVHQTFLEQHKTSLILEPETFAFSLFHSRKHIYLFMALFLLVFFLFSFFCLLFPSFVFFLSISFYLLRVVLVHMQQSNYLNSMLLQNKIHSPESWECSTPQLSNQFVVLLSYVNSPLKPHKNPLWSSWIENKSSFPSPYKNM
jgi:hypothetical protein